MNILLVNSCPKFIDDLGFFKRKILKETLNIIPPIGLMYIQSLLKKKGHNVRLYDHYLESDIDKLNNLVNDFSPDVIGFSSTSPSIKNSDRINNYLKKKYDFASVLGGAHITAKPEFLLESNFDYGIMGEGEYGLSQLIEFLEGERKIKDVTNLIYRGKNGSLKKNKVNRIEMIDFINTPDYSDVNLSRYSPTPASCKRTPWAHIMTSRGCPFNCKYCDRSIFGQKIIFRSFENIKKEINFLIENQEIREIRFFDDTFTLNKELVLQVCDFLKDTNLIWTCLTRVDQIDKEMLQKMKESGCYQLLFGFESGSNEILKKFNKGTTVEQNREAIEMTKKIGMGVRGSFIVGSPYETKESLEKTLKFALNNDIDYVNFNVYENFPGSEIYKENKNVDSSYYAPSSHEFIPAGMTKDEFSKYVSRMYRKFYLRPNYILKRLKEIDSLEQLKFKFYGALYVLLF